jgi:uncharacterized protein
MAISLYDTSVSAYLQTLGATSRFLDKGLAHCTEHKLDPEQIVETRLFPDMLPFRFQVQSIVHHSLGTIEAIKQGTFKPGGDYTAHDYRALQALVQGAQAQLEKETRESIDAREGAELFLLLGENKIRFTTEDFVLSFSLPNFHFHATTAYDILRSKGVPLGKRDYLGRLRLQR